MDNNLLSKKVGIIGGGQLGKMMINEAAKMGIYTMILDPSIECPAGYLANDKIVAGFDDTKSLIKLAQKVDVLTCEFEHISTKALKTLEEKGHKVYPGSQVLSIIQNKFHQKKELQNHNIPIGDFMKVEGVDSIKIAGQQYGYPIMLKSSLGGYDGKGNYLIRNLEDIEAAYEKLQGDKNPLYVEKFIPFEKEISVLCCRSIDGEIVVYPVAENVHKDSILFETCVPAAITEKNEKDALDIAKRVCAVFKSVGIICVEMFLTKTGEILVNEVAPRPHNSGHYTIEGCVTSQFENHIRAVIGLPLGSTALIRPTVMRNILGEEGYQGQPYVQGVKETLKIEGLKLHIYGKTETKYQRKMGHLTVTAPSLEEAKIKAKEAGALVRIISQ
ncbi:5-(carboxyamino)imidazole ribonucleotide synthase [Mobilitalea sibirica]|uniref:N5-carboxyaminoimidazole ribonucleotide synthase n=1 Tax=Mobilitalea sibirica TaxID=1462919 RepID=A0A8J7HC59_9FIRM|nr:5-(carboxyamino)imidazole ribonucleotide synthase [Mobilitalea sibirica]MBH1941801.1 5-(carboxyamino)imidazole ribonucleotide synthase [Mobilitalea sibirica]